jgi:hypothetical protein
MAMMRKWNVANDGSFGMFRNVLGKLEESHGNISGIASASETGLMDKSSGTLD